MSEWYSEQVQLCEWFCQAYFGAANTLDLAFGGGGGVGVEVVKLG